LGGYGGYAYGPGASTVVGGDSGQASASGAITLGGNGASALNFNCVAQGYITSCNSNGGVALGSSVVTNGDFAFAGGRESQTENQGQFSRSGASFGSGQRGDAQMSIITVGQIKALAPNTLVKLTTDPGTSSASTLYGLVMAGDNRTWAVNYQLNYVCTVSGGGGNDPAVGDTYTGEGTFFAKKIAGVVISATQPVDYVATHDAYYTGGKVPVLSTTFAGSELKFNVTTGATTNTNTYRIMATLSITEVAWV
jgi:hypothetical protein